MAEVPHTGRTTLRQIATLLGVTPATVSLALRDSPEISRKTRERVKRAADLLGYRPDPELGKLMHHLRVTRTPAYRSTLHALTDLPTDEPRLAQVVHGARSRAAELGFDLVLDRWPAEANGVEKLHRTLRHRGVEGVLLFPTLSPTAFADVACDWSHFAVVAISRQPIEPDFDRIVAHWYWSIARALHELVGHGYGRVGLLYSAAFDRRINHKLSAAAAHRETLPGLRHMAPFPYVDPARLDGTHGETLENWFARESPDALLIDHHAVAGPLRARLGLAVPGRVALATLNREPDSPLAGVSERWNEIGAHAVSLLQQKILSGQKGAPATPLVTMVKGSWVHGPSVPRRAEPVAAPTRDLTV